MEINSGSHSHYIYIYIYIQAKTSKYEWKPFILIVYIDNKNSWTFVDVVYVGVFFLESRLFSFLFFFATKI
jgi:hypothetical protein